MATRIGQAINEANTRVDTALADAQTAAQDLEEELGDDYDLQGDYDTAVAGINQQRQDTLNQIGTDYNNAVDTANQQLGDSLATADSTRTDAFDQITSSYTSQIDQIESTYTSAVQAAEDAYVAVEAAAWATYQSAYDAAQASFTSTKDSAIVVRDVALATVTTTISTSVAGSDPTYQTTIQAAYDAYVAALTSAGDTYNATMQSLTDASMQAADAAFEAAVQAADDTHAAAVQAASGAHSAAVQSAGDAFDTAKQNLFDTLESSVQGAVDTFNGVVDTANSQNTTDIASAESDYTSAIDDAQAAYDDIVGSIPENYKNDIKTAGDGLVTAILDAYEAAKQARNAASTAFTSAVRGATDGLAGDLDGIADSINQLFAGVQQAHQAVIDQAWIDYTDALGNFDGSGYSDMESYYTAYEAHMTQATIDMYSTVGADAISQLGQLKGSYPSELEGAYGRIQSWVDALGEADKAYSVAMARASAQYASTVEIADTTFLQTIATSKAGYEQQIKSEAQKLAIAKVKAEDMRERDIATANHKQATTIADAAKVLDDAIAEAEKAYTDGYSDAWDTFQDGLTTAWETLTQSLSDADTDWVDSVIAADSAWVAATTSAASTYASGAAAAYNAAVSAINTAVTTYVTTVNNTWAAAVNAYYNGSADAATVTSAWLAYSNAVLSAWTAANSAISSASNSYSSTTSDAGNSRVQSLSSAAQSRASDSDAARVTAIATGIAAQRSYDDSVRSALVDNAKALAQSEYSRATETAAIEQQTITALADEYKDTIHTYANNHESAYTSYYSSVGGAAAAAIGEAYGIVNTIYSESIGESAAIVAEAVQKAENEADEQKARAIKIIELARDMASLSSKQGFDISIDEIQDFLDSLDGQSFGGVGMGEVSRFSEYLIGYPPGIIESAKSAGEQLLDRIQMEEDMGAYYGEGGASGGAMTEVMSALFPSGQTAIYDQNGTFVGYHDHAAGDVWRWIPTDSGGRTHGYRDIDSVQSMANSVGPGFSSRDWDVYFGGAPAVNEPEPQSLSYKAITFFISEEQLAAPGGLTSDILLTAQLVTEIVGTVDPTGASDVLGAATMAANGDYAGASMNLAGALIPGGAEKFLKYAKRVPTNKLDDAADGINQARRRVGDAADDFQPSLAKVDNRPNVSTPEPNCFIAGTQVIVDRKPRAVASLPEVGDTLDGQEVVAVSMLAAGIGLAIVREQLAGSDDKKKRRRQPARGRKQRSTSPIKPQFAAVDPSSPVTVPILTTLRSDAKETVLPKQQSATVHQKTDASPLTHRQPQLDTSSSLQRGNRLWTVLTGLVLTGLVLACFGAAGWLGFSSQATQELTASSVDSPTTPVEYVTKNIEDLRAGDYVFARDEYGRKIEKRRVTKVFRKFSDHLRHLTFEDEDGNRQTLQTTDEHPFWSTNLSRFINAEKLVVGDKVTDPTQHNQTLVSSWRQEHPDGIAVFNFRVEGFYTYFVKANGYRGPPVLVHNADHVYRSMSPEEFAEAQHGRWTDGPIGENDGYKYAWSDEAPAQEWADMMRANGEDQIVTKIDLFEDSSNFNQWEHFSPTGTVVEAPLGSLG